MKFPFLRLIAIASLTTATSRAAEPTALEQYMLEIINRARADGNAEARMFGLSSVNDGSPSIFGEPWTIESVAAPLVWNEQLSASARGQAQALFTAGFMSGDPHTFGGTSPEQRIAAAGFVTCLTCPKTHTVSGFTPGVENFGFAGRTSPYTAAQLQAEIPAIHRLLFADGTTPGRLHRNTLMNGWFREVGLGLVSGTIGGQGRVYLMMDFDKAEPGTQLFLTGVVYNDTTTADQFYTPGEGLGGLKVQAWQSGIKIAETTTWASGGYRLPLAAGAWQIKLVNTAGSVSEMGIVTLVSENVKLDSRTPVFTAPPPPVNLRLTQSGSAAVLLQWEDPSYALFSSDSLAGPWTAVGIPSPASITIQPGRRFFRCQK